MYWDRWLTNYIYVPRSARVVLNLFFPFYGLYFEQVDFNEEYYNTVV